MEDKNFYLQKQAEELEKLGMEIDELKALVDKARVESKRVRIQQINELRLKTETAQDNLMQVFFSMKEARS